MALQIEEEMSRRAFNLQLRTRSAVTGSGLTTLYFTYLRLLDSGYGVANTKSAIKCVDDLRGCVGRSGHYVV